MNTLEWRDEVIQKLIELWPGAELTSGQLDVWREALVNKPIGLVMKALGRAYAESKGRTPRLCEVIRLCTGQTSDVPENITADERKASYYESIRKRWLKDPTVDQRWVASMTHADIECHCRHEWFRTALATYGTASVSTVHYWKQWQDQLAEMGTGKRIEGGVHDPVVMARYAAFLASEGMEA